MHACGALEALDVWLPMPAAHTNCSMLTLHAPWSSPARHSCPALPPHSPTPPRLRPGTWGPEVEAEGGKIVITRKDGSQAVVGYSEEEDPTKVREGGAVEALAWRLTGPSACQADAGACLRGTTQKKRPRMRRSGRRLRAGFEVARLLPTSAPHSCCWLCSWTGRRWAWSWCSSAPASS